MIVSESNYFKAHELQCHHCNQCGMDSEFMLKLDRMRHVLEIPMHLSSAYRCPEHNNNVSNTAYDGPHTTGKAVDILVYGELAWKTLKIAMLAEFKGIGVSQKGRKTKRFIHVDDIDDESRPSVWSY